MRSEHPKNLANQERHHARQTPAPVVGLLSVVLSLAMAIGGALTWVFYDNAQKQREFENLVRNNSLEGKVAYVVGKEVHVVAANDMYKKDAHIKRFQFSPVPQQMMWINDDEIMWSAPAYNGETTIKGNEFDFKVVSEALYKGRLSTGETMMLLNPYSPELEKYWGNVAKKDSDKEQELEKMFNDDKPGIKISIGKNATIIIQQLAYSNEENRIYTNISGAWFTIDQQGKEIHRAFQIPHLKTEHHKSKDSRFMIEDPFIGPLRLTDGRAEGYLLEEGSDSPAWYYEE